ncbi:MAG TPA: HdeD family acid-resistance protein [Polyangia bacterium]|nr:HdeD family acid-resistance protein [Polyangia bacterium]
MLEAKETVGLASRWGWVVFRGVIGVLFGLVAFARPGAMAFSMVLVFGCYAFISGIATVIAAARSGRAGESWGALLLEGLISIAVGAVAVLWPASTALAFVWAIGVWAIASGILEIVSAVRLRKLIAHEWALGIGGVLSIALGFLMFYRPLAGGLAVVWWLGAYALLFGVMMIVLGFRLRRVAHPRVQIPSEGLRQRL